MSKTYKVEGMSCGGCVNSVTRAIQELAPQAQVDIQLDGGLVSVDGVEDDALIEKAVDNAGFTYAGVAG